MNVSSISAIKSMVQEATETLAQTRAEAARGDQQAIRKLAMEQVFDGSQGQSQSAFSIDSNLGKLDVRA